MYDRHPLGVDPENAAHWPWNVARPRLVVAPVPDDAVADYVPTVRAMPDPKAIRPCTAHGCVDPCAGVRRRTHPALYDFCDRHRTAGMTRIRRGRHPLTVADDMTAGSRVIGRPRSAA